MKVKNILASALFLSGLSAQAATVAIIDSGVDYRHRELASHIWANPNSSTTDADGTTYQADTHGWNFAENNNEIIDYSYLGTFSADCNRFFEIQGKRLLGTATPDELQWYTDRRNDQNFLKELSKFGNFVHGTHVAGISNVGITTTKLAGVKLIATEPPGGLIAEARAFAAEHPNLDKDAANNLLARIFLKLIAGRQASLLATVGKYTAAIHAEVANGSFGTSVAAVSPIVSQLLAQFLGHEPSAEETHDYSVYFVSEIVNASKSFPQASPNTLFVFAAGNDGTNNDVEPTSPANVKFDNTIAVAATLGVSSLAVFSNYGATLVEVAAPGVVIDSTIPGDAHMTLSGTSMAAPYVTNAAARVKEANPALTPAQVKAVLMGTVDVKEWLRGKVSTSGIVNTERAIHAARLTLTMNVQAAIAQAKTAVGDVRDDSKAGLDTKDMFVLPLPSTF